MRNLKRALSLALAAIMVLGLMVVGASAASTYDNFTDKDEIVNQEAVNTMVSLGVLAGKDDGSYFDPTGIVTRGEMAKIVAVCLNGGKEPVLGDSTNIPKFSDVPTTHWAYNYIAYCVQQNIIAGRGDGTFAPDEPVTGSAAAKMFLCALGYRADLEGLVGNEWELNTNILANQDAKLYEGLEGINASAGLSRDNTAQMAYNAVQADEVSYNNLQGDYAGVIQTRSVGTMLSRRFGVVKVEGVVVANDVFGLGFNAASAGKAQFLDTNTYRTENNEVRNYNGVYPVDIPNEYVGQRVVIYVKFPNALAPNAAASKVIGEPILSSKNTVATTGERLKDADAVKSFLRDNNLSISNNDSAAANDVGANNNPIRYEGVKALTKDDFTWNNGRITTEAVGVNGTAGRKMTFIDHTGDGTVDYIITENPTLAQVTVYDETNEELTIAGEGSLAFKEIANPTDAAKGDMVLYVKYDDTFYLSKPETVTGAVTAFISGTPSKVTMDGTNYTASANGLTATGTTLEVLDADESLIGNSYIFYLDAYGNVVAKDLYEEEFGNYALVVDTAAGTAAGTNLANSGEVKLMLNDGTTAVYKVNMLASAARFGYHGTDDQKEQQMADQLRANATTGVKPLVGSIVTYVVDGSNVTIGDPAQTTGYGNIKGGTTTPATDPVQRANASYDITWNDNAGTAHTTGVIVNDNTLFYVRSSTYKADGTFDSYRYSLIKGLSNVPQDDIDGATVIAAAYRTRTVDGNTTNTAKAVVVEDVRNDFKGSREFVYIIGNYTQTQDQIKNDIYEYPAVFEDGEKTTILVKNGTTATNETTNPNTNVTIRSGMIYEYRMNGSYAELFLTNSTWNNQVTSQVSGKSMQVRLGTNGADKQTHTLGTTVINVEDSDKVYVMDSAPSAAMSVAYGLDSDGKVSLIFVRDSDVHFRNVYNWTNSTMNINGVPVAAGQPIAVANGFDITVPGTAGAKLVGYADYDGSKADEYLRSDISSTTALGSITMPANADVKIGSTNGTASTTFDLENYKNNVGGGSSVTPTGEYTITFYTGQWPDSGSGAKYSFYVNGTKVTSFTEGVGTKSFTVKNTDTVAISGFQFNNDEKNNATVTLATGVTGKINLNARSVTFQVSSNVTLNDPDTVKKSATGGDETVTTPAIKTELTLKTADGTVVSGGTVTKAEVNSTNQKLDLEITLPAGYDHANGAKATVNYVANSTSTKIEMSSAGDTSTGDGKYVDSSSAAADTVIGDGSGVLKITLEVTAPTTAKVSYSGAVVVTDASNTDTLTKLNLEGQAAQALKFKLDASEIPAYAKETKITYKLTGTTKDGEYTVTTATAGVVLGTEAGGPNTINAKGDVTVEIVKVEATKVAVTVTSSVTGVTGTSANATNGVAVGETALGGITLAGLAANAKSAEVTYTITGAESVGGSKLTDTVTLTAASGAATLDLTPVGTEKYNALGTSAVTVNIDSVVYKTYDQTKVTLFGTFSLGGQNVTLGGLASEIKLTKQADGSYVNTEALTLTLTPSSNFNAGKYAEVNFIGATYTGAAPLKSTTTAASQNPVTITITAGSLTIDPATNIQLALVEKS